MPPFRSTQTDWDNVVASCCERFHWLPSDACDMSPNQLITILTINNKDESPSVSNNKSLRSELNQLRGK